MGQTLSIQDKRQLAYVASKAAEDKRTAKHNEHHWDSRSDGRISILGRLRRYPERRDSAISFLKTYAVQLFVNTDTKADLWNALGKTIALAMKARNNPKFNLSENFAMGAEYVSKELANTLQDEAQRLMDAFQDPAACEHTLRKQALDKHGLVFCEDLQAYAISAKRLNELRSEFRCSHGSKHIHVFREITSTHRMCPNRGHVNGERAPAYVHT